MKRNITNQDIRQLIEGSEPAFDLVYRVYSSKIYSLAYGFLKNREQSEEVVQETFINLWVNRESLNAEGNIWLFLYVISKRLSLNMLRRESISRQFAEKVMKKMSLLENNTIELIELRDFEKFSEKVIDELPLRQQQIYKLSRVEGLTHREIAEQLQISPNTVKNHMVEALKTLKSKIDYSSLASLFLIILFF